MGIKIIPAYNHVQEIEILFSEYTDMLIEGDSTFREYLALQNYDEEVKHPEQKYGLPPRKIINSEGGISATYWYKKSLRMPEKSDTPICS